MSALAFYTKAQGCQDATSDFRIRKMFEGWGREQVKNPDDHFHITTEILVKMNQEWKDMCRDSYEVTLFKSAAMLTFLGAFRISEPVASGREDRSRAALQITDMRVEQDRAIIHMCRSKLDQWGKGIQVVLGIFSIQNICPVRVLRTYLKLRGREEGFLLCHNDGSPLTKFQFWKITDSVLKWLGLIDMRFSTYSFRIVTASTAASLGYGPDTIQ
ncbi:hypothetical protein JRQ81_019472 [Phrynocephalus forsythii]|uniref:Uncharacterized protein n=1 Tax=Phrynocephalus forsythii TaxID=171643 RepID=A0A9Q0XLZ2_9SAUR|nr:hypothetical protein JRQ81_019472 [Phrynocephalus forsythii]